MVTANTQALSPASHGDVVLREPITASSQGGLIRGMDVQRG